MGGKKLIPSTPPPTPTTPNPPPILEIPKATNFKPNIKGTLVFHSLFQYFFT